MATRTPSPAQLAARKTFAEMARAGAFKKRALPVARKNPIKKMRKESEQARLDREFLAWSKKVGNSIYSRADDAERRGAAPKRKKNPYSDMNQPPAPKGPGNVFAKRNPAKKRAKPRRRNPELGVDHWDTAPDRREAPALRGRPKKRNPSMPAHRSPSMYCVHRVKADGEPGALIAKFATLPLAKEYASAYATAHKAAVGIIGKR